MSRMMFVGSPTEQFEREITCEYVETTDLDTALDIVDDFSPTIIMVSYPIDLKSARLFLETIDRNNTSIDNCIAIVITKEKNNHEEKLMKLKIYYTNEENAKILFNNFLKQPNKKNQILDKLCVLQALARNVSKTMDMGFKGVKPSNRYLKTASNKVAI